MIDQAEFERRAIELSSSPGRRRQIAAALLQVQRETVEECAQERRKELRKLKLRMDLMRCEFDDQVAVLTAKLGLAMDAGITFSEGLDGARAHNISEERLREELSELNEGNRDEL